MQCSKCGINNYCKDSLVHGRQHYKCKECIYRCTVSQRSGVKPVETRRMAFEMYLKDLCFSAICHLFQIIYGTVYQWIKNFEKQVESPKRNEQIEIVVLDKMHTYVGRKNGFAALI